MEEKRTAADVELLERNFPEGQVLWVELDEPLRFQALPPRDADPSDRWVASDPEAGLQWHLYNTRSDEAWNLGYSGKGGIVSVLDSGCNKHSSDLGNLDMNNSWNYVTEKSDPTPPESKCMEGGDDCSHGTTCANLAVGQSNNFCGVGIAPGSTLQGFLILAPRGYQSQVTNSDWADAQSYPTDISSNSYGSVACSKRKGDITCTLHTHSKLDQAIVEDLTTTGRDGKGTIITYASGNDGDIFEDTNIQGVLTLRQINAIGASTSTYTRASFSCPGAGLMCVAPGNSLFGSTVEITSRGRKEMCSNIGSGTSWACPIVAGAASMFLEANNKLSWRDFQHIIVRSSYRDITHSYITNAAGRKFSYDTGFGHLDVYNAVRLAANWTSFPVERSTSAKNSTKITVGTTMDYYITVNTDLMVESINMILDITTQSRGGLDIELISPSGTKHSVMKARPDNGASYHAWKTLARGFWDERSKGRWTVRVTKNSKYENPGTTHINSIQLDVYGTNPSEYPNAPDFKPKVEAPHLKAGDVSRSTVSVLFQQTKSTTVVARNELQMKTASTQWVGAGSSSTSTVQATGLKASTTYMFRGRSQVGQDWSEWGQVLTVKTRA